MSPGRELYLRALSNKLGSKSQLAQSVTCVDVGDDKSLKKALKQLSQIVKVRIKRMTQAEVDMYTGKDRYVYYRGAYSRSERVRQIEQRARRYNRFFYERSSIYDEVNFKKKGDGEINEGTKTNTFYNDSGLKTCSKSSYGARSLNGNVDRLNKKRETSPDLSQSRCKRTKQDVKDYQRDSGGRLTNSYCNGRNSQEFPYRGDRYRQVSQGWPYKYCNEKRNAVVHQHKQNPKCEGFSAGRSSFMADDRSRFHWQRGPQKEKEATHSSEPLRSDKNIKSKECNELNKNQMGKSDVKVTLNNVEIKKHIYHGEQSDWSRSVKFLSATSGGSDLLSASSREPEKHQISSAKEECKSSKHDDRVILAKNSSSSLEVNTDGKLGSDTRNKLPCKSMKNTNDNYSAVSSKYDGSNITQVVSSACASSELSQKDEAEVITEHNSAPQNYLKESVSSDNHKDTSKDSYGKEVPQIEQCVLKNKSVNNSDLGRSTNESDLGSAQVKTAKGHNLTGGKELPVNIQERGPTSKYPQTDLITFAGAQLKLMLNKGAVISNHEGKDLCRNESFPKTEVVLMTDSQELPEAIQNLTESEPVSIEVVDTGCEQNSSSYTSHIVDDKCTKQENLRGINHGDKVKPSIESNGNLEISGSGVNCPVAHEVDPISIDSETLVVQKSCPPLAKDDESGAEFHSEYSLHAEKNSSTHLVNAETMNRTAESESKSVSVEVLVPPIESVDYNGNASREPPNEVTSEKLCHFPTHGAVKVDPAISSATLNSGMRESVAVQKGSLLAKRILDNCINLRKTSNVINHNGSLVKKNITKEVNKNISKKNVLYSNVKEKSTDKVPENNLLIVPEKRKKYTMLFEELFGKDDDDDVEIFSKVGAVQDGHYGKKEKEPSSSSFKTSIETKLESATTLVDVCKKVSSSQIAKKNSGSISSKEVIENSSKKCSSRSASLDVAPSVEDSTVSQKAELPWVLKEIELEVIKDPRLSTSRRRKSSNLKIEKIAKRLKRNASAPNASHSSIDKTTVSSESEALTSHNEIKTTEYIPSEAKTSCTGNSKKLDCSLIAEKELQTLNGREGNQTKQGNVAIISDENCNIVEENLRAEDKNINLQRKKTVLNSEEDQRNLKSMNDNVNVIAKISSHEEKNVAFNAHKTVGNSLVYNSGSMPELENGTTLGATQEGTVLDEANSDVSENIYKSKESVSGCPSPVQTKEISNVSSERLSHGTGGSIILSTCRHNDGHKTVNESSNTSDSIQTSREIPIVNINDEPNHSLQPNGNGEKSKTSNHEILASRKTQIDLGTGSTVNGNRTENLHQGIPVSVVNITVNNEVSLNKPQTYIRVKDPKSLGIRSTTAEDNRLQYLAKVKELMHKLFQAAPPDVILKVRDLCRLTISVRNDLYHYMIQKHQITNSPLLALDKASDLNCAWHCLYFCCEPKAGNINKMLDILYNYFKSQIQTAVLYALELEGCKTSDSREVFHFVKKITKYRCCPSTNENCSTSAEVNPHVILRSLPRQSSYMDYVASVQWKSKLAQVGGSMNTGSYLHSGSAMPNSSIADKPSSQQIQNSYSTVPFSRHPTVNVTGNQTAGVPYSQSELRFSKTANVNQYNGNKSTLQQNDKVKSNFELAQRIYSGHMNKNNVVGHPKSHAVHPHPPGTHSTNPVPRGVPNVTIVDANYGKVIKEHLHPQGRISTNLGQSQVPNIPVASVNCGTHQNETMMYQEQLSNVVNPQQRVTTSSWLPHTASATNTFMKPPPPYGYNNRVNSAPSVNFPCSVVQCSTSEVNSGESRTTGAQQVIPRRYSYDSNTENSTNLRNSSAYNRWNSHLVSESHHKIVEDANSVVGGRQNHNYSQMPQHMATVDVQNTINRNTPCTAAAPQNSELLRALVQGNRLSTSNFHQQNGGMMSQNYLQQNQLTNQQPNWQRMPQLNFPLPSTLGHQTVTAYSSAVHHSMNTEAKQPNYQNEPLGYRAVVQSQFTTAPLSKEQLCTPTQSLIPVPVTSFPVQQNAIFGMQKHFPTQALYNVVPHTTKNSQQLQPQLSSPATVQSQQVSQHPVIHPKSTVPSVGEPRQAAESETLLTYMRHSRVGQDQLFSLQSVEKCVSNQTDSNTVLHIRDSSIEQQQVTEATASAYGQQQLIHQGQLDPNVSYNQPTATHYGIYPYRPTAADVEQRLDKTTLQNHSSSLSQQTVQPKNKTVQNIVQIPKPQSRRKQDLQTTKQDQGMHFNAGSAALFALRNKLQTRKRSPPVSLTTVAEQQAYNFKSPNRTVPFGSTSLHQVSKLNLPKEGQVTQSCQPIAPTGAVQQQSTELNQVDHQFSQNWSTLIHNLVTQSLSSNSLPTEPKVLSSNCQISSLSQSLTQETYRNPQITQSHVPLSPESVFEKTMSLQPGQQYSEVTQFAQVSTAGRVQVTKPQLQISTVSRPAPTTYSNAGLPVVSTQEMTQIKFPIPCLPQQSGKVNIPVSTCNQVPFVMVCNKVVQLAPKLSDPPLSQIGFQHAPQINLQQGKITKPAVVQLQVAPPSVAAVQVTMTSNCFNHVNSYQLSQLPNVVMQNSQVSTNISSESVLPSSTPGNISEPSGTSINLVGVTTRNNSLPITVDHVSTTTAETQINESQVSSQTVITIDKPAEELPPILEKQVDTTDILVNSSLSVEQGESIVNEMPLLACQEGAKDEHQVVSLEGERPSTLSQVQTKSIITYPKENTKDHLNSDSMPKENPSTKESNLSECPPDISVQLSTVVSFASVYKQNLQHDCTPTDSDVQVPCRDSVVTTTQKVSEHGEQSDTALNAENCSEMVISSSEDCQSASLEKGLENHQESDLEEQTPPLATKIYNEQSKSSLSLDAVDTTSPALHQVEQVTSSQLPVITPVETSSESSNCTEQLCGPIKSVTSISELKALIDSGEIVSISQLKNLLYSSYLSSENGLTLPERMIIEEQPMCIKRDTVLKGPVNLKPVSNDQPENNLSTNLTENVAAIKLDSPEEVLTDDVQGTVSNLHVDLHQADNLLSSAVNSESEHLQNAASSVSDNVFLDDSSNDNKSNLNEKKDPSPPEKNLDTHSTESPENCARFNEEEGSDCESDFIDLTFQPVDDFEELEIVAKNKGRKVRLLNDDEIDEIVNNLESADVSNECSNETILSVKQSSVETVSHDCDPLTNCSTDYSNGSSDGNTNIKNSPGESTKMKEQPTLLNKEDMNMEVVNENEIESAIADGTASSEPNSEQRKESYESACSYTELHSNAQPAQEDNYQTLRSPAYSVISSDSGGLQDVFITEEIDIKSEGTCSDTEDLKIIDRIHTKTHQCVCCCSSDDDEEEVTILDQIIRKCDPDIEILEVFPKEVEVLHTIKKEEFLSTDSKDFSNTDCYLKCEDDSSVCDSTSVEDESCERQPILTTKSEPGAFSSGEDYRSTKDEQTSDSESDGCSLSDDGSDDSSEKSFVPLVLPVDKRGDETDKRCYAVYPDNVKCAACSNTAVLLCSGCRITCYCSVVCQCAKTAGLTRHMDWYSCLENQHAQIPYNDWVECHMKECDGHLRNVTCADEETSTSC